MHKAIEIGNFFICPRADKEKKDDFGWKYNDVVKYFSKLREKHFEKQMPRKSWTPNNYYGDIPIIYDVYTSDDIMGEKVYTHFYFNEDALIIDSLHLLN